MGAQMDSSKAPDARAYLTCLEAHLDDDERAVRCAQVRDAIERWQLQLKTALREPQPMKAYRSLETMILACDAAKNILTIVAHRQQTTQASVDTTASCSTAVWRPGKHSRSF